MEKERICPGKQAPGMIHSRGSVGQGLSRLSIGRARTPATATPVSSSVGDASAIDETCEVGKIDGLHQVLLKARVARALAIGFLTVTGDCKQERLAKVRLLS